MDLETKLLFGRLLGEFYRLQKRTDPKMVEAADAQIYGLINGIESIIDSEIQLSCSVSKEQMNTIANLINEIWLDKEKLESFNWYIHIEPKLHGTGIDKSHMMVALTYFKARGQFREFFEILPKTSPPCEMLKLDLPENL